MCVCVWPKKNWYLRMSELAQITNAIIKSRDGISTPDALNSSSQCIPV